eukprot:GEMP01073732.1.p1 GENE.GEMP01073732.1~~GEMP01073732.1.p1  ORF type:complete len:180 (+),score=27.06 GEMP01073732.1:176-715(+)
MPLCRWKRLSRSIRIKIETNDCYNRGGWEIWLAMALRNAITLTEAEENSWLWDQRLEIIQQPREILFVPSQWAHHVSNETDCISLNRNWFCGPTWPRVWNFLLSELDNVEKELDDIRDVDDWDDICQNVLLANSNMNTRMWEEMLYMVPGKSAWAQGMVDEARKAFQEWKTTLVLARRR